MAIVDEAAFSVVRQAEGAAAMQLAVPGIADAAQPSCDIAVVIGPAGAAETARAAVNLRICARIVAPAAGVLRATGHAAVTAGAEDARTTLSRFGAGVSDAAWIAAGHRRAAEVAEHAAGAFGTPATAAEAVIGAGQVAGAIQIGVAGIATAARAAALDLSPTGIVNIAALVIATSGLAADTIFCTSQAGGAITVSIALTATATEATAVQRGPTPVRNEPTRVFGTASQTASPRVIALVAGSAIVLVIAPTAIAAVLFASAINTAPESVATAVVDVSALAGIAFVAAALQTIAAAERDTVIGMVARFGDATEPRALQLAATAIIDKAALVLPAFKLRFAACSLANEYSLAAVVDGAALVWFARGPRLAA
jgi:hypothetical protein